MPPPASVGQVLVPPRTGKPIIVPVLVPIEPDLWKPKERPEEELHVLEVPDLVKSVMRPLKSTLRDIKRGVLLSLPLCEFCWRSRVLTWRLFLRLRSLLRCAVYAEKMEADISDDRVNNYRAIMPNYMVGV